MIDQFPVRKISWVWTLKPSLTTARSFMICPLYWHYAWSWTTAMSDFSGWQQKGKERIGFWLHPFKRFNLFSHSSGKKKKHLAGHLTFFLYENYWVLKGKANEGTNPPNCRRPAAASDPLGSGQSTHLVSNLFSVWGTMNPYHIPLTRTSWVNGTWCYRRQGPREMLLGGTALSHTNGEPLGAERQKPEQPRCALQTGLQGSAGVVTASEILGFRQITSLT